MSSCTFRCVPHTFFSSSSDVVSGGCHSPVTTSVSRPFFLKYPFFYSDTPFFLSRSRQARSYGFVCRPMYVSSPCPIGTAAFGRTLAINSKTGSASYRNQYEWKLFQMNFRRSQIIFPCANLWNSFHFFPKVSVDDSQIPALPIYAGIFLFLMFTKRVFRDKLSAAILSNKKYKNLPFSAGTKRVFVHFSWLPQNLFLIEAP